MIKYKYKFYIKYLVRKIEWYVVLNGCLKNVEIFSKIFI